MHNKPCFVADIQLLYFLDHLLSLNLMLVSAQHECNNLGRRLSRIQENNNKNTFCFVDILREGYAVEANNKDSMLTYLERESRYRACFSIV